MKRMNVLIEEERLEEVRKLLNAESYSSAINLSLAETLRQLRVQRFTQYFGSGIWEGNLSEMRQDSGSKKATRRKANHR